MTVLELGSEGSRVFVVPVIKGLKSETEKVMKAFEQVRPDKIAISISKEELDGLRNIPEDYSPELSRYEYIYARQLGRYGSIASPPPCYVAALEISNHFQVPIVPIDLDESDYTDLYCASVSGTDLFRHSTRTWWLKRKRFRASSADQFVREWDKVVNRIQGFATLERKRTEAMTNGILAELRSSKRLLVVIELERSEDVVKSLERELADHAKVKKS
jgi:hypothetical protein